MIILILLLNFAISWWNCYAVGGMWAESKAIGGFTRVVAWSAAIQSVAGFSSVFIFVLAFLANTFDVLPDTALKQVLSLWYILIIIPVIGSGLALTIHSWIQFAREKSLMNLAGASWNTFAQAYNMYNAVEGIGEAFGDVKNLFDIDPESDDIKGIGILLLVVAIVAVALGGGVVLTYALIKRYAARLPMPEHA